MPSAATYAAIRGHDWGYGSGAEIVYAVRGCLSAPLAMGYKLFFATRGLTSRRSPRLGA